MNRTKANFYHHGRFYLSAVMGVVVYAIFLAGGGPQPLAAAADAFFAAYLVASLGLALGHSTADLKRRAARQDEGARVVLAIALGVIALNVAAVFLALQRSASLDAVSLALLLAAAPLGWFVLHTIFAFHYANLHYFDPPGEGKPGKALLFPGDEEPDIWDFVYFSFVIGMTAQVSDVNITARDMRRAVTAHSIVSFFFNTVLIALAVNAAVASH